jgi:chemotaxis protein methyltransferase CheR
MSDREFRFLSELVRRESGIHLTESKRTLLSGRLSRRLRGLGMESVAAYCKHLRADAGGHELVQLIDAVATNETRFFREPDRLQYLQEKIFPLWKQRGEASAAARHIRVWSAACSTGEEPYTLAMLLLDQFPSESGWSLEILATDISTRVLARARAAVWPITRSADVPRELLRRYMLRGAGSCSGLMKAGPVLRSSVSFRRVNLTAPSYSVAGPFDLIFCRNVLIYFDQETKVRVVGSLVDRLSPDGFLFSGHAESLTTFFADGLKSRSAGVYTRRDTDTSRERSGERADRR